MGAGNLRCLFVLRLAFAIPGGGGCVAIGKCYWNEGCQISVQVPVCVSFDGSVGKEQGNEGSFSEHEVVLSGGKC